MNCIERVDWDSNFFGFEIGRITIDDLNGFNYKDFKNESEKYRLVYVLSKDNLNLNNLTLVDNKVVFHRENISNINRLSFTENMVLFDERKHDVDQLVSLALESGVYSRFYLDKNFKNGEYRKLYTEWILKSINGELAFNILIANEKSKILGFTTIVKKNEILADIGLVAVHKDARGRGIGMGLINKTIEIARESNFKEIQVVTQMDNIPARKLYTNANFVIKDNINIYHFWNL
ncbi:GNAT family N-acetyltransferase [Pedobacter sp.]|jgi:dTDP-4-amino-4,6-dideoxy-D-galactose acyltransferase|uniref:GNAT family N-acetyltransferase n=1 Tax=Pedobacter sp. TaxID=1411316 RepID=UPI002B54E894|nr:GNAT family N-acetyltransferase [Pedobacter sp.]HWW39895.1 GNAT family N-acetyltransferase [Pedobacter sp.]